MRTFVYGFTPEQVQTIDEILKTLAFVPAAVIRPEHGGAKVEAILAGEPAAAEALVARERLVLFYEYQDQDINRFINAYPIPALPQPIWAAVTEVNRHWTFKELLAALQKEHRQVESARSMPDSQSL